MNTHQKKVLLPEYASFLKEKYLTEIVEKGNNLLLGAEIENTFVSDQLKESFKFKKDFIETLLNTLSQGQNIVNVYNPVFSGIEKMGLLIETFDLLLLGHIHQKLLLSFLPKYSLDTCINNTITGELMAEYLKIQKKACDSVEQVNKRESDEKLSLIFNSSTDLMLLVSVEPDGSFRPVSANNAYLNTIHAYKPDMTDDQFFGRTLKEITLELLGLDQTMADYVQNKYNEAIQAGETIRYEESVVLENGSFYSEVALTPIFKDGTCTNILYVTRDITQRKLAEIALEEQKRELKRSNEALEHFAAVASHDLMEPVRVIKQYVQLLAKRYKGQLDSDADDFINFIVDGSVRMEVLINNLLDYAKIGNLNKTLKVSSSDAALVLAIKNLKRRIEETGALIIHDNLPDIKADPVQLTQVFQNLIANALKYSKKEINPEVIIKAENKDSEWLFSIQDNGIGIEEEDFDKIFKLFKRLHTSEEYSGAGIGLALCKKVIEGHGGKIWLDSKLGKGSTFFFTIPINN
jgi:signal transduction histidine kinase